MDYVIGIDIGTGSTKAVAVDTTGKVLAVHQQAYPTHHPQPTYSEQDPEAIWAAFRKCIAGVTGELNKSPRAVVLSSAMHSIFAVSKTGKPLMNMITWADNRSAEIADEIRTSQHGKEIYASSGTPIHAMTPLCKIKWIGKHEKDLFQQTEKFISIKEYVWYKLFNVYEIDWSIASATGLFEINKLEWNPLSMSTCGVTPSLLGTPVETTHQRLLSDKGVCKEIGLAVDTPFIIGGSDGCLANLGSFAIEPGTAALTIGTSGAIRVASRNPTINFEAMTFNYRLFKDLFISGGPINNGGVTLKWYAQRFLNIKLDKSSDYDNLLDAIDTTAAGSHGLVFLPYLLGERAPVWDSNATGVFFGIRNYHTQHHFTRAVVEGVSMALYSIMKAMESSGLVINQVNVSGGFVHSTGWLQILADIFNKPIILIHDEDASSIGAAFIGLKALGLIDDYRQLDDQEHTSFKPNAANHEVYQKIFEVFQNIYPKLKDDMHKLASFNTEKESK